MVLAHGLAGSARNFLPQARSLSNTRRAWLYDARGHARSDSPEGDAAHGWACLIADLDFVVRQALAETSFDVAARAVVGGLSLGAATALFWAIRHPGVASGLVLAAYPESTQEQRHWAANFADCIESDGLDAAGYQFVWGPQGRFSSEDSSKIRRGFLEHSSKSIVAVLRQAMAKIPDISEIRPDLEQLRVPTLVAVGALDSSSLTASRLVAEAIPNARLVVIEGAGHVVNLSKPSAFNEELARFLGSL